MTPAEEKKIIEEIIRKRSLPYSLELIEVKGDIYTVRNNFGSKIVYIKKGDDFIIEES